MKYLKAKETNLTGWSLDSCVIDLNYDKKIVDARLAVDSPLYRIKVLIPFLLSVWGIVCAIMKMAVEYSFP